MMNMDHSHNAQKKPPKYSKMFHGFTTKALLSILFETRLNISTTPIILKSLIASVCLSPYRLYERLKTNKIISNITINHPPIFILGSYRNGTTHLHNLLLQHQCFSHLSIAEAAAFPYAKLTTRGGILSFLIKDFKNKRPMDNLIQTPRSPQEEEFALMTFFPHTWLPALLFGQKYKYFIDKYLIPSKMSAKKYAQWKNAYLYVLKKITYLHPGKPLLLKNPPNTARIKELLEIFPNAKFIYIYRNPYDVYSSLLHMFKSLSKEVTNATTLPLGAEEGVLYLYKTLTQTYLDQYHLIPPANLIEIKYEDLENKPLKELDRIFKFLNIDYTNDHRTITEKYLHEQQNYEKNRHYLNNESIKKINHHWHFALSQWGYAIQSENP